MTIKCNTLRPGLLVSLKTTVHGNVSYQKNDIEADHVTADGVQQAKWETVRTIIDPVEHEAAGKVRSKARNAITAVCANSAFGLLCPESSADDLDKAIKAARDIVEEFNSRATLSRVSLYVIAGRIAADDVEAMRAINSEVRDLLADMESGIQRCEVKAIRDAANKARGLGQMLTPEASARIQVAIDAARRTARRMVDAGEQAAQEIDRRTLQTLAEARTAFLDFDGAGDDVAAPQAESRTLDFAPTPTIETAATMPRAVAFELD